MPKFCLLYTKIERWASSHPLTVKDVCGLATKPIALQVLAQHAAEACLAARVEGQKWDLGVSAAVENEVRLVFKFSRNWQRSRVDLNPLQVVKYR